MPSTGLTNSYNFKLLDVFHTTTGYVLKLANPIPTTSAYRFVYIPTRQHPSLLMLDFLVAERRSWSAELQESLLDAVRQDLQGDDSFVVLSADGDPGRSGLPLPDLLQALRPQGHGTLDADDPLQALPSEKRSTLEADDRAALRFQRLAEAVPDPTSFADRSLDRTTRVSRQVFLSQNVVRNLSKLDHGELAVRVDRERLIVDWQAAQGTRRSVQALTFHRLEEALRSLKHPHLHLHRTEEASRNLARSTEKHLDIRADRLLRRPELAVAALEQAERSLAKNAWRIQEYTKGRLLHRNYPTELFRLEEATRAVSRDACRPQPDTWGYRRIDSRSGLYLREPQETAVRHTASPLGIVREYEQGRTHRHIETYIDRHYELAVRPRKVDASVINRFELAERAREADAFLNRSRNLSTRIHRVDARIDDERPAAVRLNREPLYLDDSRSLGEKRNDRSVYVDRDAPDAARDIDNNPTWIQTERASASKELSRNTAPILDPFETAVRDHWAHDTYLERIESAVKSLPKPTWIIDERSAGFLKYRQYPVLLHEIETALRDNRSPLWIVNEQPRAELVIRQFDLLLHQDPLRADRRAAHDLHVDREQSRAVRLNQRNAWYEHASAQAARRHEFSLFTERARLAADRDFTDSLHLLEHYAHGHRDDNVEGFIDRFFDRAERPHQHDLYLPKEQNAGSRPFQHDLLLLRNDDGTNSLSPAERLHTAPLYIPADGVDTRTGVRPNQRAAAPILHDLDAAVREGAHRLHVEIDAPRAQRLLKLHAAAVHRLDAALRETSRDTYVPRDYDFGRLLHRNYPTVLHRIETAVRDHAAPLHIEQDRSTGTRSNARDLRLETQHLLARRDLTRDAVAPHDDRTAYRRNRHGLYVPKTPLADAARDDRHDALVPRDHRQAHREDVHDLRIGQPPASAQRDDSHGLYLPKTPLADAARDDVHDLLLQRSAQARRQDRRDLYLPPPTPTLGQRKSARDLFVARVAEAHRPDRHDAYIPREGIGSWYESGDPYTRNKLPYPSLLVDPEELGLILPRLGHLPEGGPFGTLIKYFLYGTIQDPLLLGELPRREMSLLEDLFAHRPNLRDSAFLEDILAQHDKLAELLDDLFVADRRFDGSGFLQEDFLQAAKQRLDAMLEAGMLFADYDPLGNQVAPALLTYGFEGHRESRPAHVEEETHEGEISFRPSLFEIEQGLGDLEARGGVHADEPLLGQEPDRPALFEDAPSFARLPQRTGDLSTEKWGRVDPYASQLDEGGQAHRSERGSHLQPAENSLLGNRPGREGALDDETPTTASLQERLALLATGYIFGGTKPERASYLYDLYQLASRGIRDGVLPDRDPMLLARTFLRTGIIGEDLFAHDAGRAALLVEEILTGLLTAREALTPEEIRLALRDDDQLSLLLEDVLDGDRDLVNALLMEYRAYGQRLQHGDATLDGPVLMAASDHLRDAFLKEVESLGQGLLYSYDDDILAQSDDVEQWTAGFALPDEYDPYDPHNEYYPYESEIDGQADWVKFNSNNAQPGLWQRREDLFEWKSLIGQEAVSGWYWNNFEHDDYQFSVDFKVDGEDDDAAGIVFRYIDPQNYYLFQTHGGDSDNSLGMNKPMQLYRVVGGRPTPIGLPLYPHHPFRWQKGTWHTAEVTVDGNRITIRVDGTLQYDFTE